MKGRWQPVATALAVIATLIISGCQEHYELRVPLDAGETISEGDAVFVDGREAGEITRIEKGAKESRAVITISAGDKVRARLRSGIFRDNATDRINIVTASIDTNAAPLPSGTLVPRSAGLPAILRVFGKDQTIKAAAVVLALVIVFTLVFRFFFKVAFILATLTLAAGLAWVTVPFAVPLVEQVYAQSPVVSETKATEQSRGGVTSSVRQVLIKQPDPVLLSFGGLTFIYFILLTILLGTAIGSLAKKR